MVTAGHPVVGEGDVGTDEDVGLELDAVPQLDPALDGDTVTNLHVILDEDVVADVAVLPNGCLWEDVREGPNPCACADRRRLAEALRVHEGLGAAHAEYPLQAEITWLTCSSVRNGCSGSDTWCCANRVARGRGPTLGTGTSRIAF
jgi:hypothetical protein